MARLLQVLLSSLHSLQSFSPLSLSFFRFFTFRAVHPYFHSPQQPHNLIIFILSSVSLWKYSYEPTPDRPTPLPFHSISTFTTPFNVNHGQLVRLTHSSSMQSLTLYVCRTDYISLTLVCSDCLTVPNVPLLTKFL